jgi:long-chain acyl-CoA synthetase
MKPGRKTPRRRWSGAAEAPRALGAGGGPPALILSPVFQADAMTPMSRPQAIAQLTAKGQPFELEEAVINGRSLRVFTQAPRSLRALFEAAATPLPFLAYEDERYTFAQAWAQAARIAHVLVHECGVKPGDRVAIAMRNYPEWMLAFMAITSLGAIAVAMNAHWQADELQHALLDGDARCILADQERLDRLALCAGLPAGLSVLAVRPSKPLPQGGLKVQGLAERVAALGDVPMPAAELAPDDLAIMLFTSGSTGHPKGVPSSHRNVLSALLSWELDRAIGEAVAGIEPPVPAEQPGTLLAVPLFHVTGLHASFLVSFRLQRRLVSMYRWEPEAAARLIDAHRLTTVVVPSAMSGDLVRVAQSGQHDLSTLQYVGGGGAARPPEQVRQIRASFPQALPNIGWGMTETNAIGTGTGGEEYLGRPASSGRCSLVLNIKVVDDAGHALPPGQRGELLVRGTSVFAGYWNRPEANAQAFVGDWFRTGDVATLDEDGFLYIVDRIKDLIIRGGENIGCGQVEAALLMHPKVREATVYAVPDERLGEEVGATVYLEADAPDDDALREFLSAHLARFELPRFIRRVHQPLPRTPSGKVLKREIRAQALADMQASEGRFPPSQKKAAP